MKPARSLLLSAVVLAMSGTAAHAVDQLVIADPVISYAVPGIFEGAYIGGYAGGVLNPSNNYHYNYGNGWHDNRFALGGFVGYNFLYSDNVITGAEIQGGPNFNSSDDVGFDVFALGRVGLLTSETLLLYGAAGVGSYEGVFSFAVGGGVEYANFGDFGIRAEILGIGELGNNPNPINTAGISAAKVTFGIVWHIN